VGAVGDFFVKSAAAFGGEIFHRVDVDAKQSGDAEPAEALAEVAEAPVGKGAAAVGGSDGEKGCNMSRHAEARDHVAGIKAAHRMRDDEDVVALNQVELAEYRFLELDGTADDTGGGVDGCDDQWVAATGDGVVNAAVVAEAHWPEGNVGESKNSVVKDDRGHSPYRGLLMGLWKHSPDLTEWCRSDQSMKY
jgi:hypothetical protein